MDPTAELERVRQENAELRQRVQELSEECADLRDCCEVNGVQYKETLATRQHRRSFERACAEHPIGRACTASEAVGMAGVNFGKIPAFSEMANTVVIGSGYSFIFSVTFPTFSNQFGIVDDFSKNSEITFLVKYLFYAKDGQLNTESRPNNPNMLQKLCN